MIKQLRNKKGFTLIEIIVVIVILAVLMAVAVPSVLNYINEGNNAKYMSTARGAMIQAQTLLAKTYAGTATDNQGHEITSTEAALKEAVYQTNKGNAPEVETITVTPTVADEGDPSGVTTYIVNFKDGKVATVTVNGKVAISKVAINN